MTTPAKTTDVSPAAAATQPAPVLAPLGWVVVLVASSFAVFATWYLFPIDAEGMWAGYRTGMVATAAVLLALALRTSLPRTPVVALIGLCGALLVLFALVYNTTTAIFVTEIGGGVAIVLGAVMCALGRKP